MNANKKAAKQATDSGHRVRKGRIIEDLILCEDVRRETRGKHTLVGVFGEEIIIGNWPTGEDEKVAISLVIFVRLRRQAAFDEILVRLKAPDGKVLLKGDLTVDRSEELEGALITVIAGGQRPLVLSVPGLHTFEIDYAGKRDSRSFVVVADPAKYAETGT